LAQDHPSLTTPLELIRTGFTELANAWDGEALEVSVAERVSAELVPTVVKSLEKPDPEACRELATVLSWACRYSEDPIDHSLVN
jgi:hypothetical protein